MPVQSLRSPHQWGEVSMGTSPPWQKAMDQHPAAAGAARAPCLSDFRSSCALFSREAVATFAAETHEAQGLVEAWKAPGHGKPGLAEGSLPACTPAHQWALGALKNTPECPSPASLPTPSPLLRELRHPTRGCSCGPFPTGQLILA